MSATRRFRKALVRLSSLGGSRMTSGLSSVGPPPTLMITQPLASLTIVGSPLSTTLHPTTPAEKSRGAGNPPPALRLPPRPHRPRLVGHGAGALSGATWAATSRRGPDPGRPNAA